MITPPNFKSIAVLFIFLLGLLSLSTVFAAESAENSVEESVNELEGAESPLLMQVDALQQQLVGKELPEVLGKFFGNQRINVNIKMAGGDVATIGMVLEDKTVKSLVIAEVNDPTLVAEVDEASLQSIFSSSHPEVALRKALQDKKITYEPKGFTNKLRFALVSIFTSFVPKNELAATEVLSREEAGVPAAEVTGGVVSEPLNKNSASDSSESLPESAAENKPEEQDQESSDSNSEDLTEESLPEPSGPQTHTVTLIEGGFSVPQIEINVGDSVKWENERQNAQIKGFRRGMIIGVQRCSKVKSGFFQPGESFTWTFDKAETCTFVDGLYTTQTMKVVVVQ